MTQHPVTFIPSTRPPRQNQAAGAQAAQPRSGAERIWKRATRLRTRFILMMIAILCLTIVTAVAAAVYSNRAYSDLTTIGDQSIPSVDGAQAVVPAIEDAEGQTATYLANVNPATLSPCLLNSTGQQVGTLNRHDCADRNIDADLALANHELFLAGHDVSYPGGRTAIEQTEKGLEAYAGDVNLMRYEFNLATDKSSASDPHMQQAYQAYLAATNVLRQSVNTNGASTTYSEQKLPACVIGGVTIPAQTWPAGGIDQNINCLSSINKVHLDTAYQDTVKFVGVSLGVIFGLTMYCCILLLWATWSLAGTTHHVLNPLLALALLFTMLITGIVLADFDTIYGHNGSFSIIENDYNSVYDATNFKQAATIAEADQARWLLALTFHDPSANQRYQEWQNQAQTAQTSLKAVRSSTQSPQTAQLLTQIVQSWTQYNTQSNQVASTAQPGSAQNLTGAETLYSGGASQAFRQFTTTLNQFSTVRHQDYTAAFSDANGRLSSLTFLCAIAFPLLGLLGVAGILTRMREF